MQTDETDRAAFGEFPLRLVYGVLCRGRLGLTLPGGDRSVHRFSVPSVVLGGLAADPPDALMAFRNDFPLTGKAGTS